MVCAKFCSLSVFCSYIQFFTRFKFTCTFYNVNFIFLHKELNTFAHTIGNATATRDNSTKIFVKFIYGKSVI